MRRYHYVDLLRGFAAIAVLICHYRWFFARQPGEWRTDAPLPAYSALWPVYEHGGLAVQIFWVLSGFVFAAAYGRFGRALSIGEFWIHRVARLYPLHLLTLCLIAALQVVSWQLYGQWQVYPNNDLPHFALQLLFASNWFTMEQSFNAPIWSVSIEVLIYFLFLLYMKRAGLNLWVALALAAVSAVVERLTFSMIAMCSALFFTGVVIFILQDRLARLWLGAIGILLTLLAFKITGMEGVLMYLLSPCLLLMFVALDRSARALPHQLRWIGLSTYSIYLLHMPVLISFRLLGILPPLWLFAGIVIGLSVPSYRWIEAPAQDYIRNLRFRTRAPAHAGADARS